MGFRPDKDIQFQCLASPNGVTLCTRDSLSGWVWCQQHIPPAYTRHNNEHVPRLVQMHPFPSNVVVAGYFEDRWYHKDRGMECAKEHFKQQLGQVRRPGVGWVLRGWRLIPCKIKSEFTDKPGNAFC